ncbi:MAG: hypothetical protein K6T61_06120 [Bryobacteraceae bacterium]|nr:hypothetical protein [Bryobacteraceae bacterium]
MSRYVPSRRLYWAGCLACALASITAWLALRWPPLAAAAVPLLFVGASSLWLGLRPPIEIRAEHLKIGRRVIPWSTIRQVDRLYWRSPLAVRLRLSDGERLWVIYPGDLDSSSSLLRHIRRQSRLALIEGRPYREFWGEAAVTGPEHKQAARPRYHLLLPEDEAEIERLYQQLKTAGRIDNKNSADET